MARKIFLEYVWEKCIKPQLQYAFSKPHDIAYSLEAVQQAHLTTKHEPLYWTCACLSVNAGSATTNFEDEEDTEEVVIEEAEDKGKAYNTNYGKIAKAIGEVQSQGVQVNLPSINIAQQDFIPDIKNQAIIYGMQGIVNVNEEMIEKIIKNRPYTSLLDFLGKNNFTNIQMISLIKAGCFDTLEGKHRNYIMDTYLKYNAKTKVFKKEKLTMANFNKVIEYNLLPQEFEMYKKMYYFKKWIDINSIAKNNLGQKVYNLIDKDEVKFFAQVVRSHMTINKDYNTMIEGFQVKVAALKNFYDTFLEPIKEWLKSQEAIDIFYNKELDLIVQEWEDKYCKGNTSKWEMDALSFYHGEHELARVNKDLYNTVDFNSLPEELSPKSYQTSKSGVEYPIYNIVNIMGTILNVDKAKHIITLLTPQGVVDVKMFGNTFGYYNKKITKLEQGKKITLEDSWLKRGNKLLISGVRRENMFLPKRDFSNGFGKMIRLIIGIENGKLLLQSDRNKEGS